MGPVQSNGSGFREELCLTFVSPASGSVFSRNARNSVPRVEWATLMGSLGPRRPTAATAAPDSHAVHP